MPRQTNTRHLLLQATQQRMQRAGYTGFSFREVAQDVGIRKASIYSHFASKEALTAAMLDQVADGLTGWCLGQAGHAPMERLRAYCFDLYGTKLGAGKQTCPVGALFFSWDGLPDAVQEAAQRAIRVHEQFVAHALAGAAERGDIRLAEDADLTAMAHWFISCVQGALNVARVTGGRPAYDRLCEQTLRLLSAPH